MHSFELLISSGFSMYLISDLYKDPHDSSPGLFPLKSIPRGEWRNYSEKSVPQGLADDIICHSIVLHYFSFLIISFLFPLPCYVLGICCIANSGEEGTRPDQSELTVYRRKQINRKSQCKKNNSFACLYIEVYMRK